MPPRSLKSWSYSTWNMWRECPKRIYFSKIEKRPDPLGASAQRGIRIHEMADKFIKGSLTELPVKGVGKELRALEKDFLLVKNSPTAKSELDFTFTDRWKQTHWRDWDNAWLRVKIDIFDRPKPNTITLVDLKTGRRRDYEKQLEIYALSGFKAYPDVETVIGEIWYIDDAHQGAEDAIESVKFHKKEEPALQATWEKRAGELLSDTEFEARPSKACEWCPFSKRHKGGPCDRG